MHDSVMAWVAAEVRHHGLRDASRVLEVGALDVNGSVRELFAGRYTGVDMREGPGVDIVASGHELRRAFRGEAFDVVVCTEVLEHDPAFWVTLPQIAGVLRPGGHLLLTTRGNGFGEHREPSDYWRFMPESRALLLELAGCDLVAQALDPEVPGIFVHGVRR
jgi:SAM-dependent methyltransferase